MTQTYGYDSEFEKESKRVQNLNFDKFQKMTISVKCQ